MRAGIRTAVATALVTAIALIPAAGASGAGPKVGTYFGTDGVQKASIEVLKKGKRKTVRLLGLDDACAASFADTPIALGSARSGGAFGAPWLGSSNTLTASGQLQGSFTDARRATITVTSEMRSLAIQPLPTPTNPNPTVQPGGPVCSLQYTIPLRYLPKVK